MTLPPDFVLTTEILWRGAAMFAAIDLIFIPLLAWRVSPESFGNLKWNLVAIAAFFWAALWRWVLDWGWTPVYQYLFPPWLRAWLPWLQGMHFAIITLIFWSVAIRFRRSVPVFILLGGVWGIVTHTWALYLGVVTKPPILMGASPVAVLAVAAFEFMFYECIILMISLILSTVWRWGQGTAAKDKVGFSPR